MGHHLMLIKEKFPTGFQRESLATLNRLLPLSYSIFALVDPSIRSQGMVMQNLDVETDREYQTRYCEYDPLHPDNFKDSPKSVVCLDNVLTEKEIYQSVYYLEFMKPNNMRYITDMFLRYEGEIIAALSLIRDQSMSSFSAAELILLDNLHPLFEFTLNNIYQPRRINEKAMLTEKFQLTPRELDVIEHIIVGSSNQSIADKMHVSLPTIKTHLRHIYDKTAVSSRTKLLAKIYQTIK